MVQVAIGVRSGSPLIMIRNSIDVLVYRKMLDGAQIFGQLHVEGRPFIFQQDGAPAIPLERQCCHQNDRKVLTGSSAEVQSGRREIRRDPRTRSCDQIGANVRQIPRPSPLNSRFDSLSIFLSRPGLQG